MSGQCALPFERLAVIVDPEGRGAALNMAIDEALLGRLNGVPLLRIYQWERRAISIGCFDPISPVMEKWPEYEHVRRWTGGGIVEHGNDLTFSLLVPRPFPLAEMPAGDSYRFIHAAVSDALARTGLAVETLETPAASSLTPSRACFENPVPFDLLFSGRKVAGGAQRRTRRGLLHQGSIQYGGKWGAVAEAMPQAFGRRLEARSLSGAELEAAGTLVTSKYGAESWLHRF